MPTELPIDAALPEVRSALRDRGLCVLEAPPGAGKTTRVPLAIMDDIEGRVVMLEPRRIAARTAAERMAETLGEPVGRTVGYRIRGDAKVSDATRIEVVTEGILTGRLQSDPELRGVGAVIFDEFHERSLNADLGLALCLEARAALRDDLALVVMSATLDGSGVALMLGDAPLIRSEGRTFPVETRWLDRPVPSSARMEDACAALIETALAENDGGILVFLPGEGEIRRVAARLKLPQNCRLRPLYGAMPFAEQRAAIRPERDRRKVVLATAIAETSLTIEDIRVVVDAGLARRARFDPGRGMSRLVTERASRAETTQRRGRAGRVAEGVCYRLWTRAEEGAFPAAAPAEIETADLTGLALDLAAWGTRDPGTLAFLTPPNPGALSAARDVLHRIGAIDGHGAITEAGRAMARVPAHPRLAHMLLNAGPAAADVAALASNRDPLRGAGSDLAVRLDALNLGDPRANAEALARIRTEAKWLQKLAGPSRQLSVGQMAALAYPDRVGLRRPGDDPRWILSGGTGVRMSNDDPLARARLVVVTDTDGAPREATVRQAAPITEAELRAIFGDEIVWHHKCAWSRREGRVIARQQECFGALILEDRIWRDVPNELAARAMLDGVRELGLRFPAAAERLRARVALVRSSGEDLPDMSEAGLLKNLDQWLLPYLSGVRSVADWASQDLLDPLRAMLSWEQRRILDNAAPPTFETPLGRDVPVHYDGDAPGITVRLQEMFGLTQHPVVAGQPLRITLLSPAGRPVQVTTDLPGFWGSSYADVRKDMRGRYPKHPWPEDPTVADPTLRAKARR
ncbi:MAG: ATP-dependent helicase HrpB [Pseudomonadota bacterium]